MMMTMMTMMIMMMKMMMSMLELTLIQSSKENLFPESLKLLRGRVGRRRVRHRPNGGWADKRDHQLCLNFTTSDLGTYLEAVLNQ